VWRTEVLDAREGENRVLVQTREREPRQVEIDTREFSNIPLAYAVHVYKAQGLTTDTAHVLTGGWQTDREHTYVALTRARDRADIYLSREDLGEQGMDLGAIERLGDLMARSRTEQASIARDTVERAVEHEQTAERQIQPPRQIERAGESYSDRALREQREREQAREQNIRRSVDTERQPDIQPEALRENESYSHRALREQRERERVQSIERGRDRGHGIE
jgi:hypothetical protein